MRSKKARGKRRRKRGSWKMPDSRLPLRAFVSALPGLAWLALLALAAWGYRAVTVEERIGRIDAAVREMEAASRPGTPGNP